MKNYLKISNKIHKFKFLKAKQFTHLLINKFIDLNLAYKRSSLFNLECNYKNRVWLIIIGEKL